jgi:hypothetical protein
VWHRAATGATGGSKYQQGTRAWQGGLMAGLGSEARRGVVMGQEGRSREAQEVGGAVSACHAATGRRHLIVIRLDVGPHGKERR